MGIVRIQIEFMRSEESIIEAVEQGSLEESDWGDLCKDFLRELRIEPLENREALLKKHFSYVLKHEMSTTKGLRFLY
jgi:hypothetical protein